MAELAPSHVGDYLAECPGCGDTVACPVIVEPLGNTGREVTLRAAVNVDPVAEHLADVHGVRLSRPDRR